MVAKKMKSGSVQKMFAESKPSKLKESERLEALAAAQDGFAQWMTFTVHYIQLCRRLGETHKDKRVEYTLQQFAKLHPVLQATIDELARTVNFSEAGMSAVAA